MGLEELFLHPHVWRGRAQRSRRTVLATGFERLDRYLPGGGWPIGALTEIFVRRYGIGELRLLMPALAQVSQRQDQQGWIFWIAAPYIPYAPALLGHGVNLDRLLLVHTSSGGKDCFWAIEQALRFGSCAAVLAWIQSVRPNALRRLQLAAEEHRCWVMLFRPMAAMRQRSPAALRLLIAQKGASTRVEILKCRGARPARINLPSFIAQGADRSSDPGDTEWP